MSSKIMTEFMFEVPELITERNKNEDRKIFCYLAISENQLLCWACRIITGFANVMEVFFRTITIVVYVLSIEKWKSFSRMLHNAT